MKRKDKYYDMDQEIHKYYVVAYSEKDAISTVKGNSARNIFVDRQKALEAMGSRFSSIEEHVFEVVESYTAEAVDSQD